MEIGIAISIVALVIALISAGAAWHSIRIAKRSAYNALRGAQYDYLAKKWYDIKEKEFNYPDFIDSDKTRSYKTAFSGNKLTRYEIFAWVCWAHAEDIYHNRWHNDPAFEPTIKSYKNLHYSWLMDPNNYKQFTAEPNFMKYVNELNV